MPDLPNGSQLVVCGGLASASALQRASMSARICGVPLFRARRWRFTCRARGCQSSHRVQGVPCLGHEPEASSVSRSNVPRPPAAVPATQKSDLSDDLHPLGERTARSQSQTRSRSVHIRTCDSATNLAHRTDTETLTASHMPDRARPGCALTYIPRSAAAASAAPRAPGVAG
jgi:hypothetical protein